MTTRVITLLARTRNVTDNVRVNNAFSYCNNLYFEGDNISFKMPYDKQNLTLIVIVYEIYETNLNDHSCKILYTTIWLNFTLTSFKKYMDLSSRMGRASIFSEILQRTRTFQLASRNDTALQKRVIS